MLTWHIDKDILYNDDLSNTLKALGHNVIEYSDLKSHFDKKNINDTKNNTYYGSFQLLNKLTPHPAVYGVGDTTICHNYLSYTPNKFLLNHDYIYTTWGDLKSRPDYFYNLYNTDQLFFRPNSGKKTFTGQCIKLSEFIFEANSLDRLSSIVPTTLLLMSSKKEIFREYRYFIGLDQILDYSEYSWGDKNTDVEPDNSTTEFVKILINHYKENYPIDLLYTIDVCESPNGPKLIELNSFSCAGLYNINIEKVFKKASEIILEDFNGSL